MTTRRFAIDSAYGLAWLVVIMSIGGLSIPELYARETSSWAMQARAQDWFDLAIAAPALVIAATLARRGSLVGGIVLAGAQLFAAYTLAIYAFAIHLNALFLIYCAAFGLAVYGVLASIAWLAGESPRWSEERGLPRRTAAGVLIGVGLVFAVLWLAQLVPAIGGAPPRELVETGLATNPVHVLDLALILPLHVIAGVALLRRRPIGLVLAPVVLAFGALMAASIALLAVMTGGVPVGVGMGAFAAGSAIVLVLVARGLPRGTPRMVTAGSRP